MVKEWKGKVTWSDSYTGAVAKKRFIASTREIDNRSYSFPDLAKAEGKHLDESDSQHHTQQGSDPNLLSDSYQDTTSIPVKLFRVNRIRGMCKFSSI